MTRSSAPVEAAERGRAARSDAPRSSQAWWEPASDRADPVEILRRQAETHVPALMPIRHGRMLRSPFAFLRGAAAIMTADLAATPTSGLRVPLCGEAHLLNFGGYAAPDRAPHALAAGWVAVDVAVFDRLIEDGGTGEPPGSSRWPSSKPSTTRVPDPALSSSSQHAIRLSRAKRQERRRATKC